jgi:hypothetical protein
VVTADRGPEAAVASRSASLTRRALLGAGGAALLAGCGPSAAPAARPADVLGEQLRLIQLAVAAYAGVDAPGLAAAARARESELAAALRAAGGKPGVAPSGPTGALAAYEAEGRALTAHVAAVGELHDRASRSLLGDLVAGAARAQAALAPLVHRDPLPSAFPGQAT